jgi:hypothetical protein
VLAELARAAGLEMRAPASRASRRRIELELEGASLDAALGAILGDVAHTRHYGPGGPGSPEATLRAVTVGPPVSAPAQEAPEQRATGAPDPRNGDDAERALAVSSLGPETELAELVGALRGDPSPEVRRHAAEALGGVEGGEDAFRAADALMAALADPDPDVVASAVRALEDVHDVLPDPRIRASVAALAAHRDPAVRGAVAAFLEWTDDEP